jgi:hypothetical protein
MTIVSITRIVSLAHKKMVGHDLNSEHTTFLPRVFPANSEYVCGSRFLRMSSKADTFSAHGKTPKKPS